MTPLEKARARLATIEQIAELICSGQTMTETAKIIGVDFDGVLSVVRFLRLPYAARDLSIRNEAIRKAYADGHKTRDIAAQHGITLARVWHILNNYDAKARKARAAAKARAAEQKIPVPVWVPADLIGAYRAHAVKHGEEKAASHCRRLKAASVARAA